MNPRLFTFLYAIGICCFFSLSAYAQELPGSYSSGSPVNYIRTWDANAPEQNAANLIARPLADVKQTTQYIDGLGRPLQTVVKQGSKKTGQAANDLVSPVYYNAFGRQSLTFLPFAANTVGGNASVSDGLFKLNPFQQQAGFYTDPNGPLKGQGDTWFYSQTDFESSPLNRVQKQLAPGNNWVGASRGVKTDYWINTAADDIKIWEVTDVPGGWGSYTLSSYSGGVYSAGELYKTVTTDEKGAQVIEFKDKTGHVIVKKVQLTAAADNGTNGTGADYAGWLCTYYIYDDLDNLRCVVQPEGVKLLAGNNWDMTALSGDILNEQCFRYEYDARKRMIMKKVPGAGDVYMVYDNRDRLIYTQDANMRSKQQWLASYYDDLNRPVMTAMMLYNGGRGQLQTAASQEAANGGTVVVNNTAPPTPDIYITQRQAETEYMASGSITFDDGFTSEETAEFTAEIGDVAPPQETITVSGTTPPSGSTVIPLTQTFYDDYSWTSKQYDPTYNARLTTSVPAGYAIYPEGPLSAAVQSIVPTRGLVTGSKVRVMEDPADLAKGAFLSTASFYDNKARVIQSQSDNYKGGSDITTNLYDFSGKVLSSYLSHTNKAASRKIGVGTQMLYDELNRLIDITKKIYDEDLLMGAPILNGAYIEDPALAAIKHIASYKYDELGHMKERVLSDNLEDLAYEYNVRGWLLGMNRDYLKCVNATGCSVQNYFGFELGYDKTGTVTAGGSFANPQYNGNIAGSIWKSKGDAAIRKYDFSYDNVNRLTTADFNQYASGNFDKTAGIDYSVSNLNYDGNGNILSMWQKAGLLTGADFIDKLQYTYLPHSNKLLNVIDGKNDPMTTLGDFRTSQLHPQSSLKASSPADPTTITDYTYDANGNLIRDYNKDIGTAATDGIVYNYLNLPYSITVRSATGEKGIIKYIYDALGNKLEKQVIDNTVATSTVTSYIGAFIYQNNNLQFITHEEGRIRYAVTGIVSGCPAVANPCGTGPDGQPVYCPCDPVVIGRRIDCNVDYFIKDHLGNVRSVITDEQKADVYPAATMEQDNAGAENMLYSKIEDTRVSTTSFLGYPANPPAPYYAVNTDGSLIDNSGATAENKYAAKLNGSGIKTGPGIVLKVMAGDKFSISVNSWYKSNTTSFTRVTNPLTDLLTTLAGSIGGLPGTHASAAALQANNALSPGIADFLGDPKYPDHSDRPYAFLNWVLLDEHFKYVESSSNAEQVPAESAYDNGDPSTAHMFNHIKTDLPVNKNGYLYIYVSNETQNQDVFFDNLQVVHTRGPLLEETHYYPFGLIMQGIGSKAAVSANYIENRRKFNQGSELTSDFDLGWYETPFRNLDPQIGRWHQIDPLAEANPSLSPFVFVGNNPLEYNDPYGLDTVKTTMTGGRIDIPPNPNLETVLSITNPDGSTSYYNYDPNNPAANQQGYVGSGMARTEQEVTVTGHPNPNKSSGISTPLWLDPAVSAVENRIGSALAKYRLDGYGAGRPIIPGPAQRIFDRQFPSGSYARVRPVNIHIPGLGRSVEVPRYIVSSTGRILKFAGVATAGIGVVSTEIQYSNGEISNAHRWTNHTMTVIGFLGPYGTSVSLIYSAVGEDLIFNGKDVFGFGYMLKDNPDYIVPAF